MERLIHRLFKNDMFVAALAIIGIYLLFLIHQVLFLLLISFILVIALRPVMLALQKAHVPHGLAAPIVVVVIVSSIVGLGAIIADGIASQVDTFYSSLQDATDQLPLPASVNDLDIQSLIENLPSGSGTLLGSVTSTVVSFITGLITIIVITIYWLLDYVKVKNYILSKFTNKQRARQTFRVLESRFGGWVRGQLMISLVIGTLSFIAYQLIGLPAALSLAVIAALFEVVPTVGPILAAVPAILIALTVSPQIAIVTLIANIVIQQLENHLIAPKILQRTIQLHPIAIIVVLFIGNLLFGLLGVFLAVPFTLLVISIKQGYFKKPAS